MMRVDEVMSTDPQCCTRESGLQDVARMMVEWDCGEIPVVEYLESSSIRRPVGVITDRDIVCRAIARGLNPLELAASDCMTEPCVTVTPDMPVEDCCRILEEHQIRRVPVVDAQGHICGIVSLADIARHGQTSTAAEVVKEVSEPTTASSTIGH